MIGIFSFLKSLKLTWIRRLIKQNSVFTKLCETMGKNTRSILMKEICNIKLSNSFWKNVIDAYAKLLDIIKANNWIQFETSCIWKNPSFINETKTVYLKQEAQ